LQQIYSKTYSIPLRSGLNKLIGRSDAPFHVEITLSIPRDLPSEAWGMYFGEHALDENGQTSQVINLIGRSAIVQSCDNGDSWLHHRIAGAEKRLLYNCRTLRNGHMLAQALPERSDSKFLEAKHSNTSRASVFLIDANKEVLAVFDEPTAVWHGSSSVDESPDGTIMFAEYHNNQAKYLAATAHDPALWRPLMEINRVFRSTDGGRTWQIVFEGHPEEIRHFHTLRVDPENPKRWWLSSGDRAEECKVWVSNDDGTSWKDVSQPHPDINVTRMYEGREQAVYRYTDIFFDGTHMIWGTDDLMGDALEYYQSLNLSERSGPLTLEELGYCGNPVRSLIDVGPAILAITEANKGTYPAMPQVLAFFKDNMKAPLELFKVDNFTGKLTGFTYSKASRAAKDGRFFSYRNPGDVFDGVRPCVLQWDIKFRDE
jgi:hypothetical protein